jgi:putative hydroxymethylpyrimidine transport system permease protein
MTGAIKEETRQKDRQATAGRGRSAWSRSFAKRYGPAILITIAGIGLWELIIRLAHVPEYLIPAPSQVAADMRTDWPVLGPALWVTLREILLGFVISAAAGVGLAVLLHLSSTLRRAFYPILIGSQTVPIVVLAPILVILFGYGILPKLIIVALICFFPIVVNGVEGLTTEHDAHKRNIRTQT